MKKTVCIIISTLVTAIYSAYLPAQVLKLEYSTYLGGGGDGDECEAIAVDSSGSAYVTGWTYSGDFPIENPYQASFAGYKDTFVTKLSSSGSALIYSTYLGGSSRDEGSSIAVDTALGVYVAGKTYSGDFPTENPYQASFAGDHDTFVTKLSSSGSSLIYSTYLGGSDYDYGHGIAVDTALGAYVAGLTSSVDFPIENPYQASFAGDKDTFVTKLSSSGSSLIYSTYLGGSDWDWGNGIAVDTALGVYVAGKTYSGDFPTENPYQASFNEQSSGFVTKLILISVEPRLVLESGDYNGDGTSDIAIFRRSSGLWSIRNVSRIYFGGSSDTPIPGDYNADGTTDVGIFRPSSGLWGIRGVTRLYFGSSTDRAVPADYNGDGACDVGIFREGSGLWAIQGVTRSYFGSPGDEPVPGDYDGNGSKDIGLFRGSSGLWALRKISRIYFGSGSDTAVPGDYDGSGTWKAGIFRPLTGLWAVRGVTRAYFGSDIDQPVPADYNGDGADDIGIFRGSSGLWGLKGISRVYYGSSGDIPVTR